MEKIIDFGKIDFYGTGKKENRAEIIIELRETQNGEELSICGDIWNRYNKDIICGGQCLDEMNEFFKNNELFKKIYKFWKLYHLNGMHPECEHQRELGWNKMASEKVTIYHYNLKSEIIDKQKKLDDAIIKKTIKGEEIQLTKDEKRLLTLEYFKETTNELTGEFNEFYKLYKTEEKTRGWIDYDKHSEGILGRPCPVCQYKYGHSWKFLTIPENDLQEIKNIINGVKL